MHAAVPAKLLPDRVHPNDEGAGVMAQTVYKALTGNTAPVSKP
jgi:lysophospholipase L1-like esterase